MFALQLQLRSVLFLTPANVTKHIQQEVKKLQDDFNLPIALVDGKDANNFGNVIVNVLSHESVSRMSVVEVATTKYTCDLMVLDETHMLVKKVKTISVLHKLFYARKSTIGLTGTARISPHALDAQLDILRRPCSVLDVEPVKEDDTVPKQSQTHVVKLTMKPALRNEYDNMVRDLLVDDVTKRLASVHLATKLRKMLSIAKVSQTLDFLQKNCPPPLKVAVISEYTAPLYALKMSMPMSFAQSVVTIAGISSNMKDRHSKLNTFRNDDRMRFLLARSSCIGIGVDLGFVDILIMMETSYQSHTTKQIIGRTTRLGQSPATLKHPWHVQLMYRDSIEEKLYQSNTKITPLVEVMSLASTHINPKKIKRKRRKKPTQSKLDARRAKKIAKLELEMKTALITL